MNITSFMRPNTSECAIPKGLIAHLPPLLGTLSDVVYPPFMLHKSMKMWDKEFGQGYHIFTFFT